jgi:hypothetical protein
MVERVMRPILHDGLADERPCSSTRSEQTGFGFCPVGEARERGLSGFEPGVRVERGGRLAKGQPQKAGANAESI